MRVIHLTASPFYGGPERQMLGLGRALSGECQSIYVSYPERGRCRPFLQKAGELGFEAIELRENFPQVRAAILELSELLGRLKPDVLCCHSYKPDLHGWFAARRTGTPIVAVTRGWTGATLRVRLYDTLDRLALHGMDAVVCVSEGMAVKVRRALVPRSRVSVIRNAIDTSRFDNPDPASRGIVESLFPSRPRRIVGAAGRLSPEKGFTYLVAAAVQLCESYPDTGIVIFGDGPLREKLLRQIETFGLRGKVILAGHRGDLDRLMPALDVFVLPSFAEGLPNVVLEAFAAGVPVVATAVDGTPEVVDEGDSGFLVPPGDARALADRIGRLLTDDRMRDAMGRRGRDRVGREFTFAAQAEKYRRLFERLALGRGRRQQSAFAGRGLVPAGGV